MKSDAKRMVPLDVFRVWPYPPRLAPDALLIRRPDKGVPGYCELADRRGVLSTRAFAPDILRGVAVMLAGGAAAFPPVG